ncbi:MAG: response regulator transcription factor [Bacillus subtilis]|nr:response regulator transcription factor [Bacillus subtilis]
MVGEAEDAEKGLQIVKEIKPDVVLMDLGLPGINGIEATQQIKTFDENIKVVILTSHDSR